MTEIIMCPCCGSKSIELRGSQRPLISLYCRDCFCKWHEEKRQPGHKAVDAAAKAECISLAKQAEALIINLNATARLYQNEYVCLYGAVDTMQNYIKANV